MVLLVWCNGPRTEYRASRESKHSQRNASALGEVCSLQQPGRIMNTA